MSVETEVASRSGAGQDLRVRVAVALGLIALVALSLAFRKEAFVGVAMLAAGMSLWELAAAFARKGLRLPVAPLLVGSVGIVLTAYLAGAEAMLVATILTAGAVVVWRDGSAFRPDRPRRLRCRERQHRGARPMVPAFRSRAPNRC